MTTDIGFVTDGAAARMADDKGTCVCPGSMTDVGGDCMPYSTLIPAIIGSLLGAAFLIVGAVRSHPIPCKPIHTLFLRFGSERPLTGLQPWRCSPRGHGLGQDLPCRPSRRPPASARQIGQGSRWRRTAVAAQVLCVEGPDSADGWAGRGRAVASSK